MFSELRHSRHNVLLLFETKGYGCYLDREGRVTVGRAAPVSNHMREGVEFASLQEMRHRAGLLSKLGCFVIKEKSFPLVNGRFLTCFRGGQIRVVHCL